MLETLQSALFGAKRRRERFGGYAQMPRAPGNA